MASSMTKILVEELGASQFFNGSDFVKKVASKYVYFENKFGKIGLWFSKDAFVKNPKVGVVEVKAWHGNSLVYEFSFHVPARDAKEKAQKSLARALDRLRLLAFADSFLDETVVAYFKERGFTDKRPQANFTCGLRFKGNRVHEGLRADFRLVDNHHVSIYLKADYRMGLNSTADTRCFIVEVDYAAPGWEEAAFKQVVNKLKEDTWTEHLGRQLESQLVSV